MAHAKLEPGQTGNVNAKQNPDSGQWVARMRVRLWTGKMSEARGTGITQSVAIANALKDAEEKLGNKSGGDVLTLNSLVMDTAALFFDDADEDLVNPKPRLGKSSLDRYENDYKLNVHPKFGALRLAELTVSVCEKNLKALAAEKSVQTMERAKIVLNHIIEFAIRKEVPLANPLYSAVTPLVPDTEVEPLADWELAKLRAAIWNQDLLRLGLKADGTPYGGPPPNFQKPVLFDVLTCTGLRIGEALALRWMDLTRINGKPVLYVRGTMIELKSATGKWLYNRQDWCKGGAIDNKKWRQVFIPEFVAELLEFIRPVGVLESDYIFAASPRGGRTESSPKRPSNIRDDWRPLVKSIGLHDFHPHRLRATFATAIEAAYPEPEGTWRAGKVLGHKQPEERTDTKKHYTPKSPITPDCSEVAVALINRCEELVPMPARPKAIPEKPKRVRRKTSKP